VNRLDRWLATRTTRSAPQDLKEARRLRGTTSVSLVLPARDEAETVGDLVRDLAGSLGGLVDELVVVDDGSTDGTGALAAAAGARVVTSADVRADVPSAGKGGAMWRGLAATSGELVVFLDADVRGFDPGFVASLLLPLLGDQDVHLVKAAYARPLEVDGVLHPGSGGRVTRLVATPLLNLVAPELTVFAQPLAGETAVRRGLLKRLRLVGGYGVELALLLDAYAAVGLEGLAQVDLGERAHRHQSDEALAEMSTALLHVAAARAGWATAGGDYGRVRRDVDGRLRHVRTPVREVTLPLLDPVRPRER
jgi:glucosyl-3-phosphoglycerate synthase